MWWAPQALGSIRPQYHRVTIGGVGIGDGGITGMYAVAEEAAGHVGDERAVAFGQVDQCGVELLNQGGGVGPWR